MKERKENEMGREKARERDDKEENEINNYRSKGDNPITRKLTRTDCVQVKTSVSYSLQVHIHIYIASCCNQLSIKGYNSAARFKGVRKVLA